MSESINNNQATIEEKVQGVGVLVPEDLQQNAVVLETSSSTASPNYW